MQYPTDEDTGGLLFIKDHVFLLFDAPEAAMDGIAGAPKVQHLRNTIEASHEVIQVTRACWLPHISVV